MIWIWNKTVIVNLKRIKWIFKNDSIFIRSCPAWGGKTNVTGQMLLNRRPKGAIIPVKPDSTMGGKKNKKFGLNQEFGNNSFTIQDPRSIKDIIWTYILNRIRTTKKNISDRKLRSDQTSRTGCSCMVGTKSWTHTCRLVSLDFSSNTFLHMGTAYSWHT